VELVEVRGRLDLHEEDPAAEGDRPRPGRLAEDPLERAEDLGASLAAGREPASPPGPDRLAEPNRESAHDSCAIGITT
jgi:hypothetical protein